MIIRTKQAVHYEKRTSTDETTCRSKTKSSNTEEKREKPHANIFSVDPAISYLNQTNFRIVMLCPAATIKRAPSLDTLVHTWWNHRAGISPLTRYSLLFFSLTRRLPRAPPPQQPPTKKIAILPERPLTATFSPHPPSESGQLARF